MVLVFRIAVRMVLVFTDIMVLKVFCCMHCMHAQKDFVSGMSNLRYVAPTTLVVGVATR